MYKKKKIVVCSGGFDPIHSGHIRMLRAACLLGDILVVGINSDEWLTRKKGRPFMPWKERYEVIKAISYVDAIIEFNDHDDTAIDLLKKVKRSYPTSEYEIIFANGGDRTKDNIPEMSVPGITFEFGVGGENKANSSSWILEEWKAPKTVRDWGWYRVLDDKPGYKVKELVIEPGKHLSMQRHFKRSEHWYILKGVCTLTVGADDMGRSYITHHLGPNRTFKIDTEQWHQGANLSDRTYCHILEVQYGVECREDDIERLEL